MSLHIEFEPHSWYMGFAIKAKATNNWPDSLWHAYTADGQTGHIVDFESDVLADLKWQIRQYHLRHRNGYGERIAAKRLGVLRGYIQAEGISYGQIAELQRLTPYIAADDTELLEWAGVPEGRAKS